MDIGIVLDFIVLGGEVKEVPRSLKFPLKSMNDLCGTQGREFQELRSLTMAQKRDV